MRGALLVPWLLLAACATPARVDDQLSPQAAFETFRGAVAREEHAREWACLSDGLRAALGIGSRQEWADARTLALTRRHRLIRGIVRAKVDGKPERQPDDRVMLRLDLPLGYEGRVWLAPVAVLRIEGEGGRPAYFHLPGLDVVTAPDAIGLRVPPDIAEDARDELSRRRPQSFVARIEWFLDGFAAGGDTPETVRKDMERTQ